MKIAVICHLHHPIAEPFQGGLEMHTHLLVRHLTQRGHRVEIFALPDSDPAFNLMSLQLQTISTTTPLQQHEENESFEFMDSYHTHMDIMLQIIASDYDLVHNNSLHYLPPAMAHLLPCPMVTALHTPPFPSLQSGVMTAQKFGGSSFVAVSESLCAQWRPFVPDCEVVYNGIELDRWPWRERGQSNTVFWAGRLCSEKAPHLAIAASLRAGYSLTLAGQIFEKDYFLQKIKPLLSDQIRYVGLLTQQELARQLGDAEVALFTSVWEEPFGLVLAEYLACGTPVVAFDSGAVGEIINDSCGVIVPKGDVEALAKAMPVAASRSRAACRVRIESLFRVESMIDLYLALYGEQIDRFHSHTLIPDSRSQRAAAIAATPALRRR